MARMELRREKVCTLQLGFSSNLESDCLDVSISPVTRSHSSTCIFALIDSSMFRIYIRGQRIDMVSFDPVFSLSLAYSVALYSIPLGLVFRRSNENFRLWK